MPAVCLSVLLGWCSRRGGNEARDGGTLSGAIFQSQYTSGSAHAVNQNHAPSGRVCITGGRGIGRSQCAGKQARAYRLLVTAAEDEDVNGCVTRSHQEIEHKLFCVGYRATTSLTCKLLRVLRLFGYFCSWFF